MHFLSLIVIVTFVKIIVSAEKLDLETLNNYSEFLNFGDKKRHKLNKEQLENAIFKSKIDVLGKVFKTNIDSIKLSPKLDIVFLIDSSSSVGEINFKSELKFVKKLLSDITIDYNHTRVAIITFSSQLNIVTNVDGISNSNIQHNKCHLLNQELNNISYKGGDTYTIGAFKTAKDIFATSNRNDSKKVLFLITDGYSNGGDPMELAEEMKNNQITIFTVGIENGNYKELYDIASSPGEFYSYLLDSFKEFESLARKALHVDLKSGDYTPLGYNTPCDSLCEQGDCCDKNALCSCGTSTGHYSCICKPGYYGSGLKDSCSPCPEGMYSEGPNLCLPCPDQLHITVAPAYGIESCICKPGYKASINNSCEELKCPTINVPQHGYFVKKRECLSIINSACGIRCEVGYILNGTSIRLCQENATWSGIHPTCEVKTCTRPVVPKDGKMKCFHPDLKKVYDESELKLPVDTICGFKCGNGRLLTGSQQRTCIPLAQWDGLKTVCKTVKCSKMPPIKYGKVDPPSCNHGKQEFGKKCKIICDPGFESKGPDERKCVGVRGTWSSKFEDTLCVDVTPPDLKCPQNITITTLPGRNYAHADWIEPNVTDNSGLNVTVWIKPAVSNITEFKFSIGLTPVVYFAQDVFRNPINCTFYVEVNDKEAPTIENCDDSPVFLTNSPTGTNITWDEPHIFDNSHKVEIQKSHNFGFFPIGTTTITYTATDPFGNKEICQMNVTVKESRCEVLPDPNNGHIDCENNIDGIHCLITCQDGYAIPISQLDGEDNGTHFICKHVDPVWYSQEEFANPECTITTVPEESVQFGEITLDEPQICNDTEKLEEVENDLKIFVGNELCTENCTVSAKTECELEISEETLNNIERRKRQADFEAIPHKNRNKKRKKVNVKFQVRGKYINNTAVIPTEMILSRRYNASVQLGEVKFICPVGFVPRKNRCVQCPKGTFQNQTQSKCHNCPLGYYNNKLGQVQCKSCPENYSTRKMHSKKFDDCKRMCPPGTYARKKFIRYSKHQPNKTIETTTLMPYCRSCGFGFYQPNYGKTYCIQCPPGYTTPTAKSTDVKQCIRTGQEVCKKNNVCLHGACLASNTYHYSCECFQDYIGSHCEKKINECDSNPCSNGGSCHLSTRGFTCSCKADYTGRYCENYIDDCKYKCQNNGTCLSVDTNDYMCICPIGFSGDFCQNKINYCTEHLCEHNGTCLEEEGSYKCICQDGYIGRRCHLLPCDYIPCKSKEICENLILNQTTRDSYKCKCPNGYTGENCVEKINPCIENPCLHGGTCTSSNQNDFLCSCSKRYFGIKCEHERNSKYILHFSRYDVNDYVRLPVFEKNLTEITACLWIQSLDNFNYGTLLSYATKSKDNMFTLTDYTGLVIYINNNYIVTDILLNDGQWHHLCAKWMSINGTYEIVVDGKLHQYGNNLSKGDVIEGYGNMVVGQEQDIAGGRFSQSETFVGKMTYVDIWDRFLSTSEVLSHFNDCNESFFGNLYGWPEMQEYIKGNVKVLNSSFCAKCDELKPVYNGFINTVSNVAYYSCYKGYELNNIKYSNGRKCTKAAKWEGTYEPFCKRVYCGYPGYIKNGYAIGTNYYYQDKVTFRCYEAYNLIGNSTVQCQANGQWYPEKPQCTGIQCSAFKQPSFSTLTIMAESSHEDYKENVTKFDPGTQIEIQCSEKAILAGEIVITCLENGTWDYTPPTCSMNNKETKSSKINCDIAKIPRAPNNGYADIDSLFKAGNGTTNFVEYKCRPGFKLFGDNTTTCIIDGYWTQPNATCNIIVCSDPILPKNMNYGPENTGSDKYNFGNMVSFLCRDGYTMIGNNKIRCLVSGKWSRMQGKCIKRSCKKPTIKSETTVIGRSYLFEDLVQISCPSGNTYSLKCNKDGIWEGEKDESC